MTARNAPTTWAGAFGDFPGCAALIRRLWLPAVFALGTALILTPYAYDGFRGVGSDALIYTHATRTWLAGGDPWAVALPGQSTFAAPPPSMLLYVPGVWLDDAWVQFGWIAVLLGIATLGLRRLGLPLWWLAFPPMASAIVNGSLDALLFPAIVLGWGWLAPVAKVYAVIPLLIQREWRHLMAAAVVLAVTVPVLPWGMFVADLPLVMESLREQAAHHSAWGNPIWMAVGAVALVFFGRRSGWLAVPVLWPSTQTHYAAMSVPGLTPIIAAVWSIPFLPGMPVLGVVLGALAVSRAGSPRGSWSLRHERRTRAGPARPQSVP